MAKNHPIKHTLLHALILVGIIAIIVSFGIRYARPYTKELSLQKLDETRINDLDAVNNVLNKIISATSTMSIGANHTIYISLPSNDSACSDLDLPSVPDGWKYHCVATTTLQQADGTGWLPVNFDNSLVQLPIDPINKGETLNYYAYVASSTVTIQPKSKLKLVKSKIIKPTAPIAPQFVLTAVLDSNKYLKERAQNDDGVDDIRYEVGSNVKIWADAEGLIGYWPMDEMDGITVHDISGNNYDGEVFGQHENNIPIDTFNGKSKYIFIPRNKLFDTIGSDNAPYSISLSFNILNAQESSITEKWTGAGAYPWAIRIEGSELIFALYDGVKWNDGIRVKSINFRIWNELVVVVNPQTNILKLYLNGDLEQVLPILFVHVNNNDGFTIGSRNLKDGRLFSGYIKKFKIFTKVPNDYEIYRSYSTN
ncbi:MAG: hypothetical protein NT077_01395 [Candidatus Taylorbacteria bacterium]|nr:hypothetical protein [Candidatus Taylorbacteria bacterium]